MRDKRRYGLLPLLVLMAALFSGCAAEAAQQQGGSFRAVVLELLDDGVVVEPLDGETIRKSADRVVFRTDHLPPLEAGVGDEVLVRYDGEVRETYPAGVDAVSWEIPERAVALG